MESSVPGLQECVKCKELVPPHHRVQMALKSKGVPKSLLYGGPTCVDCAAAELLQMAKRQDIGPCSHMDMSGDACQLAACVAEVKSFPTDSTSPSDQWLLKFQPGSAYMGLPISKGFMKWWIAPSTLPANTERLTDLREDCLALEYEKNVYKDVVAPLIYGKVCPNFVRYLGSSTGCELRQMVDFIANKVVTQNGKILDDNHAIVVFKRNVAAMVVGKDRDPVSKLGVDPSLTTKFRMVSNGLQLKSLRYSVLVNEAFAPGTTNFEEWMQSDMNPTPPDLFNVLFQAMVACYALSLSKTTANDFHLGNIWVEPLREPVTVVYIVDGTPYTLVMKYMALLYDFDHAYCERLGPNPKLDGWLCQQYGHCNYTSEAKDALKILMGVYIRTGGQIRSNIGNVMRNPNRPHAIDDFLNETDDHYIIKPEGGYYDKAKLESDFNSLSGPKGIINMIATLGGIQSGMANTPRVYVCDSSRFAPDGQLVSNLK